MSSLIATAIRTTLLWSVFFGLLFSLAPAQAMALKGASCVIRHGDKIVLVKEEISGKLGFPGGQVGQDTPTDAAIREVHEEMGLRVDVVKLLEVRGATGVYACVSKKPLPTVIINPIDRPIAKMDADDRVISAWRAEHFTKEVRRVYLLSVDNIEKFDFRYPNETVSLRRWLMQVPESEITDNTIDYQALNALHKWELRVIKAFQQATRTDVAWFDNTLHTIMTLFSQIGSGPVAITSLIIIAAFFGVRPLLYLSSVLLLSTLVTSLLKRWLMMPRPFYIWPELQQAQVTGFSLPCEHTLVATVMLGLLWYNLPRLLQRNSVDMRTYRVKAAPIFIFLLVMQAVSQVWLGVHYPSDTVFAFVIGAALLHGFLLWQRSGMAGKMVMQWQFWLALTTFTFFMVSINQLPHQLYVLSSGLAITCVMFGCQRWQFSTISLVKKVLLFITLSLVLAVMHHFAQTWISHTVSSTGILLIKLAMATCLLFLCFFITTLAYRTKSKASTL